MVSGVLGVLGMAMPMLMLATAPASAFPNIGVNLKEAIQKQEEVAGKPNIGPDFGFGILGSFEFKTPNHRFKSNWHGVLDRIRQETDEYAKCDLQLAGCDPRIGKWRKLVAGLKGQPADVQLTRLNKAINRMARYTDDSKVFGKKDHWATPVEFLRGRADCEDYAVVKFWSLLELGFRNDQLRLAVVRDRRRGIMHAVVTVDIGNRKVVLDSLFDHVVDERYILKYAPIYSANLEHEYAHIVSKQLRVAYLNQLENAEKGRVMKANVKQPDQPRKAGPPKSDPGSNTLAQSLVVDWT